jgi:hypothetical protein
MCYYDQNLRIPHFGKEQAGDTYYYSPLTINLFGLMDCYAYREFTGKKGSNNVASMLMHNLHRRGMLQQCSSEKRLSIITDNCYG